MEEDLEIQEEEDDDEGDNEDPAFSKSILNQKPRKLPWSLKSE